MVAVIRCELNYSDCRRSPIIYTRSRNTFSLLPRAFTIVNDRKHANAQWQSIKPRVGAILIRYPYIMARLCRHIADYDVRNQFLNACIISCPGCKARRADMNDSIQFPSSPLVVSLFLKNFDTFHLRLKCSVDPSSGIFLNARFHDGFSRCDFFVNSHVGFP